MANKSVNQKGAVSVVLAVVFLAVSALGISLGIKAVQSPTHTLPLAQQQRCSELNQYPNRKCEDTLAGPCNYGEWKYQCSQTRGPCAADAGVGVPYWCSGPLWHNMNQFGECTTQCKPAVDVPTQPPPPPSGRCFYLTAEFSYVPSDNNFDAWISFNTDDQTTSFHDIKLDKNNSHVAGYNRWDRPLPFTYWPQHTGGRIQPGATVTFTGYDDICGSLGQGNRSEINCRLNTDGTVTGNNCNYRQGYVPPQPTTTPSPPVIPPTATPTIPLGAPTQPPDNNRCHLVVFVFDQNINQPLANATVSDRSRGAVPIRYTDSSGKATFSNIEKYADFALQVTKSGYNSFFETINLNLSCSKTVRLTSQATNPTPTTPPRSSCGYLNQSCCEIFPVRFCYQGLTCRNNICQSNPTATPIPPTTAPAQEGTFNLQINFDNQLTDLYGKCPDLNLFVYLRDPSQKSYTIIHPFNYEFSSNEKQTANLNYTFTNIPNSLINIPALVAVHGYVPSGMGAMKSQYFYNSQDLSQVTSGQLFKMKFSLKKQDLFGSDNLKKECPAYFATVQNQSVPQKVGNAINNLFNLNRADRQTPKSSYNGKVIIRNPQNIPVEAVFITLHSDRKDTEGFFHRNISTDNNGQYPFTIENINAQSGVSFIKAWVRTADGNWYQNRPCKLTGDDFDCELKAEITLYVDIGPQGLQKLNSDLQKTSQTATERISRFLDNVPLGQYVKMFIISAF